MAEEMRIQLSDIHIEDDRLRNVDPAVAMIIADSIARVGQMQPIGVRKTPNGKCKYTLIFGETRCEAVALNQMSDINAKIFDVNKQQARLMEIEENLKRDDLTKLNRAIFVTEYRRIWEAEFGEIKRGGDRSKDQTADIAVWSENSAIGSFMQHAMDRLGLSERSVRSYQKVGLHLDLALRDKISGTPDADNLTLLTKVVKAGPEKQAKMLAALDAPGTDLSAALVAVEPAKKPPSERNKLKSRLYETWGRAHKDDRFEFLMAIGFDEATAQSHAAEKAVIK